VAAGLAVAAYLTRTAGIADVGAGIMILLAARRWRTVTVFVLAAALSFAA